MVDPRVPDDVDEGTADAGERGGERTGDGADPADIGSRTLALPCGERLDAVTGVDMGQREFSCACGDTHAVVMDVHPPSRFVPEDVVAVLREAVDVADDEGDFGTRHVMGMVLEEFPEEVASADVAEEGAAGYAAVWVTEMDARTLHEVVVELLVELMDHAVSHAEDEAVESEFEEQLAEFDVEAFVERYRAARDLEDEHDSVV
ncbi:MAG: DUF5815 family protein [Halobacteriaceae archaeon]